MVKMVFLFPGQGSQYVGMSKSLSDKFTIAKQTFEEADDVLGFGLSKMCFDGSLLDLNKMENMFPALLTSSVASFRVYVQEMGILPQFCAGHSLGEYSALTCSGVLKYSDALQIVRTRGTFAQEIADLGTGAMTIIDGTEKEIVEEECKKASVGDKAVAISCYNSPNQVAISGHQELVQEVEDRIMELGGQISPLIGGAPFHCPIMQPAADKLKEELKKYKFGSARYPVISNVYAKPYPEGEKVIELLASQLTNPVQWQATMNYMQRYGITMAIEMGPKNLLCNLVTANVEKIESACFGQKEDRQVLAEYLTDQNMKKHVPTVITRCLSIAVATPNLNWDAEEYQKGVAEPYKRIEEIQNELDTTGAAPTVEQMRESLEILKRIFATKKVSADEQTEWFNQIFDETSTQYIFKDFQIA